MFIVETRLKARGDEALCADLTPSGYAMKSFPRLSGRRGGGIAVIYKESLAKHLTFTSEFSFIHAAFELLQVSLTSTHSVLHFMCVYRPWPTLKNKLTETNFFDQFPDFLDHCNSIHGNLCLLGDFNFHVDCLHNRSAVKFLEHIDMFDLKQTVTESTQRHDHILDLVIVRPSDGVHLSSKVTSALESDHFCVVSQFNMVIPTPIPMPRVLLTE